LRRRFNRNVQIVPPRGEGFTSANVARQRDPSSRPGLGDIIGLSPGDLNRLQEFHPVDPRVRNFAAGDTARVEFTRMFVIQN
jgi:hypothetical protein